MRARIATMILAALLPILSGAKAPLAAEVHHATPCDTAEVFVNLILLTAELTGVELFSRKYTCGDGLLYMWVTNAWYDLPCYEREQTYVGLRDGWRNAGGSEVVLRDKIDITVATFRIFSDRPKIRGCTQEGRHDVPHRLASAGSIAP